MSARDLAGATNQTLADSAPLPPPPTEDRRRMNAFFLLRVAAHDFPARLRQVNKKGSRIAAASGSSEIRLSPVVVVFVVVVVVDTSVELSDRSRSSDRIHPASSFQVGANKHRKQSGGFGGDLGRQPSGYCGGSR